MIIEKSGTRSFQPITSEQFCQTLPTIWNQKVSVLRTPSSYNQSCASPIPIISLSENRARSTHSSLAISVFLSQTQAKSDWSKTNTSISLPFESLRMGKNISLDKIHPTYRKETDERERRDNGKRDLSARRVPLPLWR